MTAPAGPPRRYTVIEPSRTPWEGFVLAFAATLPIVAGAAGVWLFAGDLAAATLRLTLIWAAAVVAFLSGVRRGLSFRAPEGPTIGQIATFLWLFSLAFAALVAIPGPAATLALLAGYLSLAVLDTRAARIGDAPPYFARLRPVQMAVPVIALLTILARQLA